MPLTLTLRSPTQVPVNMAGILPERLRGMPPGDIERQQVAWGNRRVPLAELFDIDGRVDDDTIIFAVGAPAAVQLGAGMTTGTIRVAGSVGPLAGRQMSGGRILVDGDAGNGAGSEMAGGLLHIRGSAGSGVGASPAGHPRGMTGGTVLIDGDAGSDLGAKMRRGLIAVGGRAGEFAGVDMLAGTILVFGGCRGRPGLNMRRGTIGLFGHDDAPLLPTFRYGCRYSPPFMPLLRRELKRLGFSAADRLPQGDYALYHGDMLAGGRGEILVPTGAR